MNKGRRLNILKAVILCAGSGTRLRPFTYTKPKQLLPIANKPVMQYTFDLLKKSDIFDICMVVNNDNQNDFENYLGDGTQFGVKIEYIIQAEPLGIAHAVSKTEDWVDGDDFVLYLGDNLILEPLKNFIDKYHKTYSSAALILKHVDDPSRFGIAELAEDRIVRVVEKPKNPPTNLAIAGIYIFNPKIFDLIRKLKPSWRGEYEITDAIQLLLEEEDKITYQIMDGWWKDAGKSEDILDANEMFLQTVTFSDGYKSDYLAHVENSKIEGRVKFGRGCEIINSKITGPCVFGDNVIIKHCEIGPCVSIGADSRLKKIKAEKSILMDNVFLEDIPAKISRSIIGSRTKIALSSKSEEIKLLIGDDNGIE